MPSFWSSEVEGVSSSGSWHGHFNRAAAGQRHLAPPFATVEHNQADAGCKHPATHLRWEVPSGEDGQKFPELSLGTTPSGNGIVTAPTRTQHVTQVTESGLYIKHGAVDIHFSY